MAPPQLLQMRANKYGRRNIRIGGSDMYYILAVHIIPYHWICHRFYCSVYIQYHWKRK